MFTVVFIQNSSVCLSQERTPFNPYKKVFIQPGIGLYGVFLASQSADQPTTFVLPGLLPLNVEYGITPKWAMGITLERLGYGVFEDSVTSETKAFNFTIRSFFSRPWARKGDNFLKTDNQMRRWFLGMGISIMGWSDLYDGKTYLGKTTCMQVGYDIKRRWGNHFYYGLCYGIHTAYFHSFKDAMGVEATSRMDKSIRFDLFEFGPFCSFSFGYMIETQKKR